MSAATKLSLLKEQSKHTSKISFLGTVFGSKLGTAFFRTITFSLILFIMGLSFWSNVSIVRGHIVRQSPTWLTELNSIFDQTPEKKAFVLQSVADDLSLQIKPLTKFVGVQSLVDSDIQTIRDLAQDWITQLSPLTNYKFGSEGITSNVNQDAYFTNDLEHFLDILPGLASKTQSVMNRLWYYRVIGGLFSATLRDNWSKVSQLLDLVPKIVSYKQNILSILGHFTTRRIVVFNQNVGETRPTGGFLGSFLPLDISKGRVTIGQSQSIYFVDNVKPKPLLDHPANWYYGYYNELSTEQGIRNLNYFPCFSDTAKAIEEEFKSSPSGYGIEEMVMITPQFLQDILPANFTLDVPGVGTLNSDNILSEIERLTSIEASDKSNPKSDLTPIFQAILSKLPDLIGQQGITNTLTQLTQSVAARNIQVWMKDDSDRDFVEQLDLGASQTCANRHPQQQIITPLLANISGDKRNLITQNLYNMWTEPTLGGVMVHLTYKQLLPNETSLQRGFNKYSPLTFVGLQIPSTALNLKVQSPQQLDTPFLRPYYQAGLAHQDVNNLKTPVGIDTVINSAHDLEHGFSYDQPDGSKVLGTYILDDQISQVDFSFLLPVDQYNDVIFYGQPGMNEPSLSLGKGVSLRYGHGQVIHEPTILQSGVRLRVGE